MKKFIKKNIKIILGFILGLIWSGGIVYAAANGYLFDSDEVSYDNTASGLESTNVQDALDELYANSDAYLAGLNAAHPVGSYLETSDSSYDPNVSIGGTWVKETYHHEDKVLLWTNSDISSSMANGTILAAATDYEEVEVIGVNYTGFRKIMPTIRLAIGEVGNLIGLAGSTGDSNGIGFLVARVITFRSSDKKVFCGEAKGVQTNGSDWYVNNSNMIPYKVYGIKTTTTYKWHRIA